MKKIIFILLVLFIANMGCKKENPDICACSPVVYPTFGLVIKNSTNADLLNPVTNGAYSKSQIQLYQKDNNGNNKNIDFVINQPFSSRGQKFDYYHLVSAQIATLANSIENTFYLKIGNNEPIELNLYINKSKAKIEKLLVNKNEVPMESGEVSKYFLSIFYLNL